MEKIKFGLFSIVVLSLFGLIFYWAVNTIQSGAEFKGNKEIEKLSEENEDLKEANKKLQRELSALQVKFENELEKQTQAETQNTATVKPVSETAYKYQGLIDELEKLVDDNIVMKLKSRGTRVGTLQEFLNIYGNTSNKADNDFGAGTETALKAFQKEQGLSADGEAGVATFKKMIEWLKKKG